MENKASKVGKFFGHLTGFILFLLLKLIWRILSYPFFFGLVLIAAIRDLIIFSFRWLAYGGEAITHINKQSKNNIATILNILESELLTNNLNKNKEPND